MIVIAAVPILGARVMTSQRLEPLVRPGAKRLSADSVRFHRLRDATWPRRRGREAAIRLMHFVGSRPLAGYYLEFDVAIIDRIIYPCSDWACPSRRSRCHR